MLRFSKKAILVFEELWYHTNLDKMQETLEELEHPLDIAFAKLWIGAYVTPTMADKLIFHFQGGLISLNSRYGYISYGSSSHHQGPNQVGSDVEL